MAKILTEQRVINDNLFQYEQRLQSPYNRFIDKYPTYVTYYHINNVETTMNEGWDDAQDIIGSNSPIRFQKIKDFPLYGISQIAIALQEEEQGLDGSYEGEAVTLPHTIKPLQNDFFIINALSSQDSYLFRVTAIEYDEIHADNFYKLSFKLDAIDFGMIEKLEKQVIQDFNCITDNIGTEESCIIESGRYEKIRKVQSIYEDMRKTYLSIFYNERYNCILGEKPCGKKLYDPFMIEFVNKWELFNDKNEINTYIFNQEVQDNRFAIKYEKSIWRFIERQDISMMNNFWYFIYEGMTLPYTTFANWYDQSIYVLDISLQYNYEENFDKILPDNFINAVRNKDIIESDYGKLISQYIRNESLDIHSIPLTIHESLLSLNANLDFFFLTPIVMYIIKKILHEEMKDKIAYASL